jgi:hypothetical protein
MLYNVQTYITATDLSKCLSKNSRVSRFGRGSAFTISLNCCSFSFLLGFAAKHKMRQEFHTEYKILKCNNLNIQYWLPEINVNKYKNINIALHIYNLFFFVFC